MITLELRVEYPHEDTAKAIMDALNPDNEGYLESSLEGSTIVFKVDSDKAGTVKNATDDLMACLKIAEEVVGFTYQGH